MDEQSYDPVVGTAGVHLYSRTPGRTVWAEVTAKDEPSILIGDHRPEVGSHVQWGQRMVRIMSVGNGSPATSKRIWHAGSQSSRIDIEPHPRRDLGRRADRRADQADDDNLQP